MVLFHRVTLIQNYSAEDMPYHHLTHNSHIHKITHEDQSICSLPNCILDKLWNPFLVNHRHRRGNYLFNLPRNIRKQIKEICIKYSCKYNKVLLGTQRGDMKEFFEYCMLPSQGRRMTIITNGL